MRFPIAALNLLKCGSEPGLHVDTAHWKRDFEGRKREFFW